MRLGKAKLHGRSTRLFRPSERWQKKWLTYISEVFAVPKDLESATYVTLFARIGNTTKKLNTHNNGYKKKKKEGDYLVMSNTNVQTLLNFRLSFLEL